MFSSKKKKKPAHSLWGRTYFSILQSNVYCNDNKYCYEFSFDPTGRMKTIKNFLGNGFSDSTLTESILDGYDGSLVLI